MDKEALQQAFDKAYLGLKAQGFERSYGNDICLYRGPDGKKCALGHLIPDDQYRHDMEAKSVHTINNLFPNALPEGLRDLDGRRALNALQRCHDFAVDAADMRDRLVHFAEMHDLTVPA